MIATWEKHEGQAVEGITLLRLLGGTDRSAVYLAELEGRHCALKVVSAEGFAAPVLLARWRQASELSHPHLARLYRWGTARLEGKPVAYVAMEYAEEVLAEVDRPLTPTEAREMLAPAVAALAYLHSQGMAHARIKPSNVLSAGDVLKISGDAPRSIGEIAQWDSSPYDPPELSSSGVTPAGDAWSLGVALVEALAKRKFGHTGRRRFRWGQFLPDGLRQVVDGCLQPDPTLRWTIEDVGHWLRHGAPARKPAQRSAYARYGWPTAAGVTAIAIGAVAWQHFSRTSDRAAVPAEPPPQAAVVSTASPPASLPKPASPPPVAAPQTKQAQPVEPPLPPKAREPKASSGADDLIPDGIQPVFPQVPAKARLTIHGRVPAVVRVETDSTGAVTAATVQSGTSKYFVDLALKAARQWKFAPGDARAWTIRFLFTRDADHPVSVRATPTP